MAIHLLNILPSSTLSFHTSFELLFNTPPSYQHLRVFGCLCYPNLSSTAINKLAPRSARCIFLGYPPNHRGFRCLDLSTQRIIISRHVTFDESTFPYSTSPSISSDPSAEPADLVTQPSLFSSTTPILLPTGPSANSSSPSESTSPSLLRPSSPSTHPFTNPSTRQASSIGPALLTLMHSSSPAQRTPPQLTTSTSAQPIFPAQRSPSHVLDPASPTKAHRSPVHSPTSPPIPSRGPQPSSPPTDRPTLSTNHRQPAPSITAQPSPNTNAQPADPPAQSSLSHSMTTRSKSEIFKPCILFNLSASSLFPILPSPIAKLSLT